MRNGVTAKGIAGRTRRAQVPKEGAEPEKAQHNTQCAKIDVFAGELARREPKNLETKGKE
jgi:hypothetical protein